jgi:hypothetical protein
LHHPPLAAGGALNALNNLISVYGALNNLISVYGALNNLISVYGALNNLIDCISLNGAFSTI